MTLVPFKTIEFKTSLTEEEVRTRLRIHEEFSQTKNFFTGTTDDFLIKTKSKGSKILIKSKYGGRTSFPCKITMTISNGHATTISVRISARVIGFVLQLPLLLLILLIPSPIVIKAFFIGFLYLLGMLGFAFDVWWVRELFKKKILTAYGSKEKV
jgi:hypothetical protein